MTRSPARLFHRCVIWAFLLVKSLIVTYLVCSLYTRGSAMNGYVVWVTENPLVSAALQFALLGTVGEIISVSLRKKSFALPGNGLQVLGKIAAWALLGIIIKYGFAGMKGFVSALLEHHLIPEFMAAGVGYAFAVSLFTNLLFGPQMMFFHRLEDNLIMWEWNMKGLTTAWWTLIWFWIPAHTVTFSLPTAYQIGLAAIWSVVLGLILGLANKREPVVEEAIA